MNDKLNKEIKENDNELTAVESNKEEAVVEEVTVEPVNVFLLQHKSLVFVMFVNPLVGGLNDDV